LSKSHRPTSYLALTFNRPLIDGLLYSIDQSLGFDWASAFKSLMSTPLLKHVLGLAYNSTQAQIVLLAAALGLAGQTERLDKFMLAFMTGGVMTICVWALYPSYGAATYVYSLGAAGGLPGLNAVFRFVEPQLALQSGQMTSVTLTELTGVVGAPSFHTVMALVTVYACSSLGKWFWPVAAWNILVVASVPVFGGHHVCDVIAGVAVAAAAIYIAEWMSARLAAKAQQGKTAPAGSIVAAE
jgi:membrane-associated phospholipid phosphatase